MNLIRCPLPYDGEFMEVFYKSFFLVRAFLRYDARVPKPVDLPDAEDRLITEELAKRGDFAVVDVLETVSAMAQPDLLESGDIEDRPINATLSVKGGLQAGLFESAESEAVSVTPVPETEV